MSKELAKKPLTEISDDQLDQVTTAVQRQCTLPLIQSQQPLQS